MKLLLVPLLQNLQILPHRKTICYIHVERTGLFGLGGHMERDFRWAASRRVWLKKPASASNSTTQNGVAVWRSGPFPPGKQLSVAISLKIHRVPSFPPSVTGSTSWRMRASTSNGASFAFCSAVNEFSGQLTRTRGIAILLSGCRLTRPVLTQALVQSGKLKNFREPVGSRAWLRCRCEHEHERA